MMPAKPKIFYAKRIMAISLIVISSIMQFHHHDCNGNVVIEFLECHHNQHHRHPCNSNKGCILTIAPYEFRNSDNVVAASQDSDCVLSYTYYVTTNIDAVSIICIPDRLFTSALHGGLIGLRAPPTDLYA